eukprot:Protomagalhaensia_sp_Gyna_25__266@NODE_1126_length_2164_cov_2_997176_g894_i0_p1_GENE_NODE_1126_length_2164_cov_2_997176_g894_i0NODE_1126_length_2164_cov_2_997176_g894_i0_p1_ORF_typecomplete_len557_score96_96_NODE_1126_length_2164_cov_2_997176_g894_i04922033
MSLVVVALNLATGVISLPEEGHEEILPLAKRSALGAELRASSAEFVSALSQSLSCPESLDTQLFTQCIKSQMIKVRSVKLNEPTLEEFVEVLHTVRTVLFLSNVALAWDVTVALNDMSTYLGITASTLLGVDSNGYLHIAQIAKRCTIDSERLAAGKNLQDFGNLVQFLDLCLSIAETCIALIQEETVKAHFPVTVTDAWLRIHFTEPLVRIKQSLPVIAELEPTTKQFLMEYLGNIVSTFGHLVEVDMQPLVEMHQTEVHKMALGPRCTKLAEAVQSMCVCAELCQILQHIDEDQANGAWDTALGLCFEYWYVTYHSLATEGLMEQYQDVLAIIPQEATQYRLAETPPTLIHFLEGSVPKLLAKQNLEVAKCPVARLECARWLLLATSLVGQLCPVLLPQTAKVPVVMICCQILTSAVNDQGDFARKHFGIALIAEAMFGIMDNLAEDEFHHLYTGLKIEAVIDRVLVLVHDHAPALKLIATEQDQAEAYNRLEDAAVNFEAFRDYKRSFKA